MATEFEPRAPKKATSGSGTLKAFIVIQTLLLLGLLGWLWKLQHQVQNMPTTATRQVPSLPDAKVPAQPSTPLLSYNAAVRTAAPAVVNIYTTQKINHPRVADPVLRRFFGIPEDGQPEAANSLGSGVIVRPDGYILTNDHVVTQADTIIVALHDGRKVKAKVVGTDPDSDLAVIKIDLGQLPVLPLRQNEPQVGDVVLAIGNPFGVGQTVTHGIVSATKRSGLGINAFESFIQTDAPINPGNSGGALVDTSGQLVGINSAIYSRSGGSMGIGFAIPSDLAQNVLTQIIQHGKVVRGWLGIEVRGGQDDPTQLSTTATNPGVMVAGVVQGGPADEGGLQARDRIEQINGVALSDPAALIQYVAQQAPGSTVPVVVRRGQGLVNLKITIGERPVKRNSDDASTAEPGQDDSLDSEQTPMHQERQLPFGLDRFLGR